MPVGVTVGVKQPTDNPKTRVVAYFLHVQPKLKAILKDAEPPISTLRQPRR